ncbi:MAG: hypothetical protein J0M17_11770 [Planctomycetes bacterium]|nr:hypothetical protein [Planctomycetota bacterium]
MNSEDGFECNESLRADQAHGPCGPHGPRPPSSINKGVPKFQGSEDTIVLALYIQWDEEWERTKAFLEEAKLAAANDAQQDGGFFEVGGWLAEIKEYGAGGGNRGPRRAYVIEAVGLRFEFSRTESPNGETPNGKVTAGSLICMKLGPLGVLKLVTEFVAGMGGRLLANKLSRIDGAVDLPQVPVCEFVDAYHAGCFLCRGKQFKLIGNGRDTQTLVLGTSPMLRIYDKVREQSQSPAPAKLEFLIEHRWGGRIPDHATRVEFQLRRDDVTSIEFDGRTINSLEDYLACRAGLWAYMCNWFRLTSEPVDENHRDRAETSVLWLDVSEAFQLWTASPIVAVTRASRTRPIDEVVLDAMLVGCGISKCANDEEFSLKKLKYAVLRAVHAAIEEHGEEEIKRRWWVKRQRQLVAMPPQRDCRPGAKPKVQSFELWLANEDAYLQAVVEAGGQMPIRWDGDPLQFVDLSRIVGN